MNPTVNSETYDPSEIEIGGSNVHFRKLTILAGSVLTAGTVLGESATATKYEAAPDQASIEPFVLLNDVDATSGDVEANVYISGTFDFNKLTAPGGVTLKQLQDAWKGTAMFVVSASQP